MIEAHYEGVAAGVAATLALLVAFWILFATIRTIRRRSRKPEAAALSSPAADRQIELLTGLNERLEDKVVRLEDRIAVLERIATDPAERTARDIEALR